MLPINIWPTYVNIEARVDNMQVNYLITSFRERNLELVSNLMSTKMRNQIWNVPIVPAELNSASVLLARTLQAGYGRDRDKGQWIQGQAGSE